MKMHLWLHLKLPFITTRLSAALDKLDKGLMHWPQVQFISLYLKIVWSQGGSKDGEVIKYNEWKKKLVK